MRCIVVKSSEPTQGHAGTLLGKQEVRAGKSVLTAMTAVLAGMLAGGHRQRANGRTNGTCFPWKRKAADRWWLSSEHGHYI